MPKVYIPQVPSRYDGGARSWVPTVNLEPAQLFGDIEVMLPPEASRLPVPEQQKLLKAAMSDYSEDDMVLALGDPIIYAMTACIAMRKAPGKLRMLKWDRISSSYILVEVKF